LRGPKAAAQESQTGFNSFDIPGGKANQWGPQSLRSMDDIATRRPQGPELVGCKGLQRSERATRRVQVRAGAGRMRSGSTPLGTLPAFADEAVAANGAANH
jgi:hypothetical protein